jgi:hypothetical protein
MKLGKKSQGEAFWMAWPEMFFILLIIIGFIISIFIRNAVLSYVVVFAVGAMAGRLIGLRIRKKPLFPYFLIVLGFLIGFFLGSFTIDVNRILLIILFIIGGIASYYVHKKGYIK